MTIESLKKEEALIDKYVKLVCPKISKYKKPVLDGITDVEKYINSKYKICWILKEPYDEEGGYGGGFDLRKLHHKYLKIKDHNFGPTWGTIGKVSYSLLNNFTPLNEINELERNQYMQSLLQISFINIGKMPSKTGPETKNKDLWKHYELWKPILYWQLAKYNPDIIIYGNTMDFFWEDLELEQGKDKEFENGYFVVKNNKIHIWAYHPAQRIITLEKYLNGIINSVKKGLKLIK